MRRALFALLALLLSVQFTTAQAETRVLLGERFTSAELSLLKDLAGNRGKAEVIVGLNVAFAPEGALDQNGINAQRQEIAAATAELSALLSLEARASIRPYQSIPFMAVRVSSEDLDRLAGSNRTRSLQRDLENEPAARVPRGTLFAQPVTLPQATPRHGDGQVIAVIDTGVLATHAAFSASGSRIVHQACFSRDGLCNQACIGSDNGCETGTHVAGIAAGSATGFTGVAPGARIMSIRVFSLLPISSIPQAWDSDIISGLEEVFKKSSEHAIAAVTLGFHDTGWWSFAENCDGSKLALKAAIDNLKSIGIATIAAGGDNNNDGSLSSPGCISSAVSVGAVSAMNWNNCRFESGAGDNQPTAADKPLCNSNIASFMSLLAPGAPIRSALPGSQTSPGSTTNYGSRGGSAMAAAQVAGAWAVLKQKAPEASVESILGVLKSTGVPIASAVGTLPRIDLPRALDEIGRKKIVYTREGTGTGRVTFTAGAQACDLSCERTFLNGGQVTLTAAASPGSVFAGWSGACEGTSPTCTVQVSNAIPVTATFNTQMVAYALTISKTGNGQVTCGDGVCAATYPAGAQVTLRATPDTGWQFASWTGCTAAAATPTTCTVTLSQARTVAATFTQVTYPLTISKTGNGQVNCGDGVCAATYPAGTPVTLKATPDTGWQFASWTGCTAAATTPDQCTVTLSQARTVAATFTQVTYPLTINKTGNGQVSCGDGVCAATYPAGAQVTLRATPDSGWQFASWTGCAAAAATPDQCTVTLSQARTVTAGFTRLPVTYPLTVSTTGNGQVSCDGRACEATYPANTRVTLTATPDAGWKFDGWTGCSVSATTPNECSVSLWQARTVAARFSLLPVTYPLTVSTTGNGQVSCDGRACEATYPANARVTLRATPDAGWKFDGWTGCTVSATTPTTCSVTLSQARTVTASFSRVTYPLTVSTTGNGQVSCNDAACAPSYNAGTPVTLRATPDSGWKFDGWTGCAASSATPATCTVTMSQARTVSAAFSLLPVTYPLTVSTTGNGQVSCNDAVCAPSYNAGTPVTLRATPDSGWKFDGWTGCTVSATTPTTCTVTLSQARTVSAAFSLLPVTYPLTVSTTGNGQVSCNGAVCAPSYDAGTPVTMRATPDAGWQLAGWTGCAASAATPDQCTVTLSEARTVTASFREVPESAFTISYTKSGSGAGNVTFTSRGRVETCADNCREDYDRPTLVQLVAAAEPGSVFIGWQGDCSGTRACIVALRSARSVTAMFERLVDKELTFTKAGTGDGTLSLAPLRGTPASCVENCTLNFGFGTTLTLTAVPASGSVFTGWSGACSGARTCSVTMDAARSVTANFEKIVEKELVFTKAGTGDGTLNVAPPGGTPDSCIQNCTRSFAFGTTLTLTAVPSSGSVFTGWSGDCAGARTCSVTMDAARSVTAIFDSVTLPTLPTLSYTKAGIGSGSVSFENNRRTEICDSNCTKEYPDRSRVMLLAMPERGSVFVGWQGDCRSNRYCIVAMTGARSVTAVFEKVTLPVLSYENAGTGSGSVSFLSDGSAEACEANCTKEYPTRSLVRLVATPSPGSVSVGWEGDCSGSRSCLVSMTGDRSVTAIFDTVTAGLPMGMQ